MFALPAGVGCVLWWVFVGFLDGFIVWIVVLWVLCCCLIGDLCFLVWVCGVGCYCGGLLSVLISCACYCPLICVFGRVFIAGVIVCF